ncbi:MAG: hypothetical protein ACOH1T_03965 [Microbacteriaceae bacterium]
MVLILPRRPEVSLVGDGLHSVLSDNDTLGFVHKVGNVYVALCGSEVNHAVEVGQSLSFDRAIELVHSS